HPDPLESPPQGEGSCDAHHGEDSAHLQVLRERRVQPEDGEDEDLGHYRDPVADDHVGDRLNQRHGSGLLHAASSWLSSTPPSRSTLTSAKVRPSPSRIASLPVSACQRSKATST